jgi:hypothetical protein
MLKNLEPIKSEPYRVHNSRPPVGTFASRTPKRTFGASKDDNIAPDLRILRPTPKNSQILKHSPIISDRTWNECSDRRTSSISPILTQKDKVHQKFKSEYNAFMNKFETSDEVKIDKERHENKCLSQPGIQYNIALDIPSPPTRTFVPSPPTRTFVPSPPTRTFVPSPPVGTIKSQVLPVIPRSDPSPVQTEKEKEREEASKTISLLLFPKDDNLEESSETIPLSRKQVDVWDDGVLMSYKTFRQGPKAEDSIIFVLPPESEQTEALIPGDLDLHSEGLDYLFIGYSKKQLYEEYMLVGHDSFFILDIIEEESYVVPMHQIVRILENSHVLFIIEKMNMSLGVYPKDDSYISQIRPCKF